MQKIVSVICGVIFIILVCVFLYEQIYVFNQSQDRNENRLIASKYKDFLVPAQLPQKKDDAVGIDVAAKAAYLIDMASMKSMYAKNEKEKLPIASTTKIATAIVVLDDYRDRLNDEVTIDANMIDVEPSVINLRSGEKITVDNLLYGLLIMSGNDAAYALADYFGPRDRFISQMNQKVRQIGLNDTIYKDPAGLNDDGLSTAKDLAILTAYALRNPKFLEIVSLSNKIIYSVDNQTAHPLISTDKLILPEDKYFYAKAIGGKTGFTNIAGRVLVCAANDNDHKILSVVIKSNDSSAAGAANETRNLFEWAFNNWAWQ
jgi:D-alanyl-D-alanine carboxypeptidase (penicillin-binding protein 5/6)